MAKKPHLPFENNVPDLRKLQAPPPRTSTVTTFRSCQIAFEYELRTYHDPAECKMRIVDPFWNTEHHLGFPEAEIDAMIGLLEGMKRDIQEKKETLREAGEL